MEKSVKGVNILTIKSLLSTYKGGRVYIYLATVEIAEQFMQDAEKERFTFGDGVKPTQRDISDIIAINDNMTINYVGFIGHIAFQAAKKVGDKPLIKIDYRDILNQK